MEYLNKGFTLTYLTVLLSGHDFFCPNDPKKYSNNKFRWMIMGYIYYYFKGALADEPSPLFYSLIRKCSVVRTKERKNASKN